MPLSPGTHIGPYEVLSLLGAGGMGEVYRARDPRIGREVALKILPSSYSSDADRLRRFEQEARAAGVLNHPNILAIYDVGAENGSPYLVSELLEGETLREKLRGGSLSVGRTIDCALQVAHGLAAAHEKGIAHRDLKPENIFITKDGRVKILDFGLAKLTYSEPASGDHSRLQTVAAESQPGVVLGTVGYMSPEQARGKPSDHRSDIFTFGAILYEMLTGKRAFHGDTAADTMSAILQKDAPELSESNPNLPLALNRILKHCMEKNPEQRFQSASDVAFDLENFSAISGTAITAPPLARAKRQIWKWTQSALTAFLAVVVIVLAVKYFQRPAQPPQVFRSFIPPPEGCSFEPFSVQGFALSPNGKYLTFVARTAEGKSLLWLRALDAISAKPLEGTEGATYPFWSPDNRFIAFFAHAKLQKIEITGTPPQVLCDAPEARGGAWSPAGIILFAPKTSDVIHQVPSIGGTATPAIRVDPGKGPNQRWPTLLPDGKHFLYMENNPNELWLGELGTDKVQRLISNCTNAAYVPPDHLVFARNGILMRQTFDAKKLRLGGDPFPLVSEKIGYYLPKSYAAFSASHNGILVYLPDPNVRSQLTWMDRTGRKIGSIGEPGYYESPRLSPDGKRIAMVKVDIETRNSDIWIYDLVRESMTRFTFRPGSYYVPAWSPDGNWILYSSDTPGPQLYQKDSSGSGTEELLLQSNDWLRPADASPDGRYLALQWQNATRIMDIWLLPFSGDRKPVPLLQGPFREWDLHFSPDGKWITYTSNESGKWEVYVQPFPKGSGKWQVSTNGGLYPKWRKNGKELFYASTDGRLMTVEVKTDSTFEVSSPTPLFELPQRNTSFETDDITLYDVSPDGQRFLINIPVEKVSPSYLHLVVNWTAGLKQE